MFHLKLVYTFGCPEKVLTEVTPLGLRPMVGLRRPVFPSAKADGRRGSAQKSDFNRCPAPTNP